MAIISKKELHFLYLRIGHALFHLLTKIHLSKLIIIEISWTNIVTVTDKHNDYLLAHFDVSNECKTRNKW